MNLTADNLTSLRRAIAVANAAGIESVFISEGLIRGTSLTTRVNIISELNVPRELKLGVGNVKSLVDRLALFPDDAAITLTDKEGVVSQLTIGAGRSKIQFRCTSERLIRYPKANEDAPVAYVKLTKGELSQLSKAIRALGGETFVLAVAKAGDVLIEATSSNNEVFSLQVAAEAVFENDPQAVVHTYDGGQPVAALLLAVRDADDVTLTVGEYGSLTFNIGSVTMVIVPKATNEDGDDDE